MATKPVISLSNADGWVSVNSTSSVSVGSSFFVQNNGTHPILAVESSVQPANDALFFKVYPASDTGAVLMVSSGSLELWVKNPTSTGVVPLSVGE